MSNRIVFVAGILVGIAACALLSGTTGFAQRKPEPAKPSVKVDESKMQVAYANAYRIHTTTEECVIDFGFNMPNPADTAKPNELLFTVSQRVILSYSNTKRLNESIGTLLQRYENEFGRLAPNEDGRKPLQP